MAKYTGGYVTKTEVIPTSSTATGVWSIQEALMYQKAGIYPGLPPRALFSGGDASGGTTFTNIIEFIVTSTTGNSTDFGDLSASVGNTAAFASSTRGVIGGGYDGSSARNVMEYVTIISAGNATDFGDLLTTNYNMGGLSSSTRGIFGGGFGTSKTNTIQYVTIASTGNSQDFGDLTAAADQCSTAGSKTRGVFYAGNRSRIIDYITIASTGNATDFGDCQSNMDSDRGNIGQCSNSTTGLFAGEGTGSGNADVYKITIASTGNDTDFGGDLTVARTDLGSASSSTRAIFAGGLDGGASTERTRVIDFVDIAGGGNFSDFGDLIQTSSRGRMHLSGLSSGHGGI